MFPVRKALPHFNAIHIHTAVLLSAKYFRAGKQFTQHGFQDCFSFMCSGLSSQISWHVFCLSWVLPTSHTSTLCYGVKWKTLHENCAASIFMNMISLDLTLTNCPGVLIHKLCVLYNENVTLLDIFTILSWVFSHTLFFPSSSVSLFDSFLRSTWFVISCSTRWTRTYHVIIYTKQHLGVKIPC